MPQATDELRTKWGIEPEKATKYLESRGFVLTPEWEWEVPERYPPEQCSRPECECGVTDEEWSAIDFMQQEWDYGGIA